MLPRSRRRALVVLSAVLVVSVAWGVVTSLSAGGPYKGRVIDAETKEPIVGAVVLVYWNRESPLSLHNWAESFLAAEEVLTDEKGEFVVGKSPPGSWIPGTRVSRAYITIFYPGYGSFPLYQVRPSSRLDLDQLNELLEKFAVIELPRLKTREERRKALVNPVTVPDENKPNLLQLLDLEYSRLHPGWRRR